MGSYDGMLLGFVGNLKKLESKYAFNPNDVIKIFFFLLF